MGPYAAEANCDVDHYLTNCAHRGCTDAPRLSLYSGARSRIVFSVTAPFNRAAAAVPHSATRAKGVLGHPGAESIGRQGVLAAQQFEVLRRDGQMEDALLRADGAAA